ncbi:tetratricopeptide repeat protein [bacterium]|nr:tetratricopeptide repeat protein [bacterium]MCI0602377.1 tetratricopeptide repeat protein [bacterium]
MAIEKSKILKNAEKFVASGKIAQAIDEYLKILKENPKDWNLMIQIGDLMLKVNRTDEAIENFQKVADHYYADGFFLKAIAIYKRINKLNPNLTDICTRLADLYLKQGLTMDAKSQLHIVAQHYLSKNQNKDAIETLQRLIEIEPDNLKNRNELAKAYKNEGMIPEAIQEYLRITEELTRKNLYKECLAVLETAYKMDPKNAEVLQKLLALYRDQGEPDKGFALLEEALKADPANSEVLSMLAEAYAAKNQFPKALEVMDRAILNSPNKEPLWELKGDLYLKEGKPDKAFDQYNLVVEKEVQRKDIDRAVFLMQKITEVDSGFHPAWQKLTDLYSLLRQHANLISAHGNLADAFISKGLYKEAAQCLEKLIKLDPDDNQHQEKLKFVNSNLEQTKPGVKKPQKVYEVEPEVARPAPQRDFGAVSLSTETLPGLPSFQPQPEKVPVQTVPKPAPAKSPAPSIPSFAIVTAEEKEYVSEHLIEAEVFDKYGLIDKAIEQLHSIIGKYPYSVPAHQKLKEIYLEKGERDKAVDECIQMSRIFRKQGDMDQAEDLLSEARQINPNHAGLDRAFKDLASGVPVIQPETVAAPAQPVPKPSEQKVAKPVSIPTAKLPQKKISQIEIPSLKKLDTQLTSQTKLRTTETPSAKAPDATAAKARAALSELEKFAHKIKTQSGTFKVKPEAPKPAASAAPPPPVPPPVPAPVAEETIDIEIEIEEPAATPLAAVSDSEFEEIDFFMDQGLLEDADRLLKVLQQKYPADAGVFRRSQQLEKQLAAGKKKEEPVGPQELVLNMDDDISGPILEVGSMSGPSDSSDEIVISLDEEFGAEAIRQEADTEPKVEPILEDLPEISISPTESSGEIMLVPEAQSTEQLSDSQPESAATYGDMDESVFTEFGELEDSADAGLKSSGEIDKSFEESFSAAVDAVFKTPDSLAEEKIEEPEEVTHVKDELFEEEEDFFDLAAELEEGLLNVQSAVEEDRPPDGQNYSIEEILSDFKKGVDKQLGSEDYDTRYNLGIAYKEMGLIDEAIAEFQIAAKDPKRFLECCSMLGLCFVEKGMHKLAVKWYQRGLDTPGYSEEEYQGLRFDLAQAYESMGETDRALEVFQEVYGVSANYRNVAKKVKELQDRKNQ